MTETLWLHDIRDATAFVAAIAVKSPLRLEWHDDADLREYLLGELWILSTRYDATASSISFATWPATRSGSGSSTGRGSASADRDGSFEVTSTNGHGPNSSALTTSSVSIFWSGLSPRSTAILRQVGTRLLEGYSEIEIGRELGTSSSSISQLLRELRAELVRLEA